MKACILSMQKVNNMGSLLQSYGLKKYLENEGYEVEFIDIKRIDEDYELLGDYTQDFSNEFEKIGVIGKLSRVDQYLFNRIKAKKLLKIQVLNFDIFRKKYLEIGKSSPKYDLCVIGSDEVFNCLNAGFWGFTSQLFGNVPEANKVITYAASCGSTNYDALPNRVACKIRDTFKGISAFSVRDKNTHDFVSNLTKKEVNDNFDPVLVYDFEKEIEKSTLPAVPNRYCIVYSYYNRIHTKEEIREITEFCKKHDLTPIAVGSPQFWLRNYVVCTPFQCLKIFQNAEFVITDTFHGTIFSAKYADRFAVMLRASNKNKLEDLVKKIGVDKHLIRNFKELDGVYSIEKDKKSFDKILELESKRTINYLKNIKFMDVLENGKK